MAKADSVLKVTAKNQLAELSAKTADLQQLADESKNREAQLRSQNKASFFVLLF